jgi:hypothetical protein
MSNLLKIKSDLQKIFNQTISESIDSNFTYFLKTSAMNLLGALEASKLKEDLKFLNETKASFRKDVRTEERFLIDLYKGWVIEDAIYSWLVELTKENKDLIFNKPGCDSNREVWCGKVTSDPDVCLTSLERNLKVTLDVKAVFKAYSNVNIKHNKFIEDPQHLCLFYITELGKFFVCNPIADGIPLKPCEIWGGKLTHTYTKDFYSKVLVFPNQIINCIISRYDKEEAQST